MSEIYKFAKGKLLSTDSDKESTVERFELLITDMDGKEIGTVNPTLVVYAIDGDDAYISNRLHGPSGVIHYGKIESFSLELREEHDKGKIFTINNDDTGSCFFTEIFINNIKLTEYGHALLDTYSDNTEEHSETDYTPTDEVSLL
ncbi:MAG: hypothetical protein PG981_000726 [Wolbachia endosymbiont of Ctenocephalides orientis wCori]|nr:MAG: hypothetical protein PG981_000726 [Wolbachia endosymbiont of Ctenocephalides orientis wCori]